MSVRCERFRPEHLEAVAKLAHAAFPERANMPELLRWRYLQAPEQAGEVAFAGEDCVAMAWGLVRPYALGGRVVRVVEVQDWYCLPAYRGQATGVALLRRLMEREEPTMTFGGSEHTLAILPKLGWTHLGEARHFALPLSARVWKPRRRLGALGRPLDSAARWWFNPGRAERKDGEMVSAELSDVAPTGAPAGDPETAVPLVSQEMARWLADGERFCGRYSVQRFLVDGAERGRALCRVVETENERSGIIHQLWAREASPDLTTWMLAALVRWLAAQQVDAVRITAASQEQEAAARRLRFLHRGSSQINSFQRGKAVAFRRIAAGYDASDALFLPLAAGTGA